MYSEKELQQKYLKSIEKCKFNNDGICVDADSEYLADYCKKANLERLAELEDKIEQGTLIELGKMPFKIGDTAYGLNGLPNCIQEYKVRGYSVGRMGLRIDLGDLGPLLYKVFGEILFCSREEAEKRLLELQGDKK